MANQLHRSRKVKIVATLGPSSDSSAEIKSMFLAGADIFRLNLSHGDHSAVKRRHQIIRHLEKEFSRPICIIADLQGPKLRCGDFHNGGVELCLGEKFTFDLKLRSFIFFFEFILNLNSFFVSAIIFLLSKKFIL